MSKMKYTRYGVRNPETGEYVSVWTAKCLYHEWTTDPTKIRSYVNIEEASKLAASFCKTAEVVELTFKIKETVVVANSNVRSALDEKIAKAKEVIYALDLVDQLLWTSAQDNQYRQARRVLVKHGVDPTSV